MKLRTRAKRLKWAASRHPAMAPLPYGSWFLDVPPSVHYDLARVPDVSSLTGVTMRDGKIVALHPFTVERAT